MTRFCPQCDARFEGDVRTCPADGSPTFTASAGDPMIGRKIDGRFTITGRLGVGGMGKVYRALQHSIDRDVALKLLRPEFLTDEDAVRRFFREARAASRLANPHTITVFDFGQSIDGQFYIAMELLVGRPLSTLVQSEAHPMDPVRAVRMIDQVLEALEEAHREGVLHRDLKTDNVFVLDEPANFLKVLDFGLAKIARSDDSLITRAGTTFGTPAFMSPEQACGKELDARSDLYSVGAILFELLAGRLPFDDTSSISLIMKKLQQPAPRVAEVAPGVTLPPALDGVMNRLLAIEPALRPASASEVRRLLKDAVGLEGPSPASDPGTLHRAPSPGVQPRSTRRTMVLDQVPPMVVTPVKVDTAWNPPAPARPPLDTRIREQALVTLAKALGLSGEGWMLYDAAAKQCTSRSGRELFLSLVAEAQATSELLRRAAGSAERGEGDWGADPAIDRTRDPARRFEESVRASVPAIQGDAYLARTLDAAMAYERRVIDFWERRSLAGDASLDPAFLRCRLAEATDHVASLAEVKLRVLGLMRGAGFNSLYMRLAGQLPVRRVRAGETLFREGDPGDSMVVVVTGRFRLEVEGRPGRSTPLAEIGPGDVVGEMACLDPAPRSASVIAIPDSEVCVVDRGTLSALREGDPGTYVAVIRAVISQVADRVRQTDQRVEALSRESRPRIQAFAGAASPQVAGRFRASAGSDPSRPAQGCSFSADDMVVLDRVARSRTVGPGEWVCREGEIGNACYVLKSGQLEIVKRAGNDDLVLAHLAAGSVVGQIVLVDGGPRSASVRAVGHCALLELDRPTFERLVDAHVPLAMRFQEQLAVTGIRQLRFANEWLARLLQRRDDEARVAAARPETVRPDPPVRPSAPPPPAPRPKSDEDAARQMMIYMRAALREWGMSLEELDRVSVVVPGSMDSGG